MNYPTLDLEILDLLSLQKQVLNHAPHHYKVLAAVDRIFVSKMNKALGVTEKNANTHEYYVSLMDTNRLNITCPEHIIHICAGRIGLMDGKGSADYEIYVLTRRDPTTGLIDNENRGWQPTENIHGKATDTDIWQNEPLSFLKSKGVDHLLIKFCDALREWK